jgi:phage terminase small subunit
MGKRGPKSSNVTDLGLAVKERPKPPHWLPKIARETWKKIVGSKKPDFFQEAELLLLEQYCMCVETYHQARLRVYPKDGPPQLTQLTPQLLEIPSAHLKVMDTQRASMGMLATKLRIAVNSRVSNAKAAGEKEEPKRKQRW